jgi:ribosomal protein L37AE/L43A
MVPLNKYRKIVYKEPKFFSYAKPLTNIIGFDSEAYRSGYTFMFCTSLGDVIAPDVLFETLFTPKYFRANFVVWNLKYESGAILKLLPQPVIKHLQVHHKAKIVHKGIKYTIKYIPHKCLSIHQRKFAGSSVKFWDIAPFYGRCKLNTAAEAYLNEKKNDIDPNLFTVPYVEENFKTIADYCVQDCCLTQKLAALWVKKFNETGIAVTNLFSEASISFDYISSLTDIVTPYEFWDHNNRLIQYATESYEGGKFEITARGAFHGYEYDISSAYPYEISNLIDIRGAQVVYSKKYNTEAFYGFLRVRIHHKNPNVHLPCGLYRKLRIYPIGIYHLTITKQEYDYIRLELPSSAVSVEIIDAAWLIRRRRDYPYRSIFQDLYRLKTEYKKSDRLRSNNYKIVMNGYYGKMAQCLYDKEEDVYNAGKGWNPIYASVITANTRIAVTRLQNLMKDRCYAVHTDSIMCKDPIPSKFLGTGMGKFEFVEKGHGILVACGVYEINGVNALKGFREKTECPRCKQTDVKSTSRTENEKVFHCNKCGEDFSVGSWGLKKLLIENPDQKKITLNLLHVESWIQAMAQNHSPDNINLFATVPKILSLNCDTKRNWPAEITSTDLLSSLQKSYPLTVHEEKQPSYWKD